MGLTAWAASCPFLLARVSSGEEGEDLHMHHSVSLKYHGLHRLLLVVVRSAFGLAVGDYLLRYVLVLITFVLLTNLRCLANQIRIVRILKAARITVRLGLYRVL